MKNFLWVFALLSIVLGVSAESAEPIRPRVPSGVIDSSRGGTPIEPFIPRTGFGAHPTLRRELELGDQGDLEGIWKLPGGVRARDANWLPGRLFHSRMAPITRFAVRGAIWYQGESNCGDREDPRDYQHKMRALVHGWRQALGNEKLPVYYVQLPGSGARDGWPYLREQQRLASDIPQTGMVVTIDLDGAEIHPPNKIDGKTIVVTSSKVAAPIAVRYAYAVTPDNCNLYNRDGLPASPFCSQPNLLVYDPNLPK